MSTVYVLIGPKGSGKSYVGRLLEREFGITFLSIEDIFIKLQSKDVSTPDVQDRGYKIVEEQIGGMLDQGESVSFEITVLTPASKTLLSRLELRAHIERVQIFAPPELCLERIRTRDSARHIEISEEKIAEINELNVG